MGVRLRGPLSHSNDLGRAILDPLIGHDAAVTAVALGRVGKAVYFVSGSLLPDTDYSASDEDKQRARRSMLRVWDAVTGDPISAPLVDPHGSLGQSRLGGSLTGYRRNRRRP